MTTRTQQLEQWLATHFGAQPFTLAPLAGDASFRRYYRLQAADTSYVVMDAPPEQEALQSFITVSQLLSKHAIAAPEVINSDLTLGFALLTDLGDRQLLDQLNEDNATDYYQKAMAMIVAMQKIPVAGIPSFDHKHIGQELALFPDWFLSKEKAVTLTEGEEKVLTESFTFLTETIAQQPQVFIHRDFHSRNLMVLADDNLGVLDFQDAMHGPITYDLVSLLRDCYICWPQDQIYQWLQYYWEQIKPTDSFEQFCYWFDLTGMQRHLKVAGIFSRLHWRDGKSTYLDDLPLVLSYLQHVGQKHSQLQPLMSLLIDKGVFA